MYTWTEAFAYIVQCLKDTIAPHRGMAPDRTAFLNFLWLRLHRLNNRFQRLYLAWKAGSLPTPGAPRPGRTRASRPPPRITLPRGRLWLLKDTQRTAIGASLLRHWLATTPELQEFLQAVPKARIMLQPFCHGLGIDIDKPYGVPLVTARPDPAAIPPPEQPAAAPCEPPVAETAPDPPVVFSSA
jgi:hypothetical protein